MPKLYCPTPDELQGATPLWEGGWGYEDNRGSWFDVYQPLLLRLVNTDYGRDILRIEKRPYPVIKISKNMVTFDISKDAGPGHMLSDVRGGAKWGNVIRCRWLEVKKAIDQMNLEYLLSLPQYILRDGRKVALPRGATETTVYPNPGDGGPASDGTVMHVEAGASWSTMHDGGGTYALDTGTTFSWRLIEDPSNTFESMSRGIMSFDATAITDSDTLDSAIMSLFGNSGADTMGISPALNIYSSAPANAADLVPGDYDSLGSTDFSNDILLSSFNMSGYNAFTMNASGLAHISFSAVSSFGMRDSVYDAPNSAPTTTGTADRLATITTWGSDNSGTDKDPKLVIQHTTVSAVPRLIMF